MGALGQASMRDGEAWRADPRVTSCGSKGEKPPELGEKEQPAGREPQSWVLESPGKEGWLWKGPCGLGYCGYRILTIVLSNH